MQLLRGEPGSGKTAHIFREFKAAVAQGRTGVRLIVPTATLVRHCRHELARDGAVFPPARILTLTRFASECAPEVKVIPEGLRYAIVRDVLGSGITGEFGEVASTQGLAATIIETIALFENAGLTPATVKTKRPQPLGAAFFKIWSAVDAEIRKRGFATRLDLFREAALRLASLPVDTVWMDGFLTFSQIEKDFLRALDQKVSLTLSLPLGKEAQDAHRFTLTLLAKDRLLSGGRPKPEVESFQPTTPAREADEICRRVIQLTERGYAFREIGVALRDNSVYLPVIRAAFERFGIPARYYFATAFAAHPASRFLKGLLEAALQGWELEQTLEAFRAHPKWRGNSGFDRFDFALREAMPGRGLEALRACIEAEFPDAENRLRQGLLHCLRIDGWRNQPHTPTQWQQKFEALTELLEDRTAPVEPDFVNIEAARSYAAAAQVWCDAAAQAAAFWPATQGPVTLEAFWAIASECISGANLRVADDRRNVVHVMSAFEARQWEVRALFVCGMSDRDYPRRHSENLLFPDQEIKRLGLPVRTARERDDEEATLFPSLIQRARETLILSAAKKDIAGRSAVISRFLLPYEERATPWRLVKPEALVDPGTPGLPNQIQDPKLLTRLATLHSQVSPTALESLAQCHFQFFANKALRLKAAPDRPEDRFNFLVAGNILHNVMKNWAEQADPDILQIYEEAFDAAVESNRIPTGYKLEVERFRKRQIIAALDLAPRWKADRIMPELEIRLPITESIELKGRVDRIDVIGNRCIIIDYKSGNATNVKKLIDDATKLQGPLYALAAHRQFELEPMAMFYWALNGNKRYGWGEIPNAGLDLVEMPGDWMESAIDRVVEKLGSYLSGSIAPMPTNPESCRFCDFKGACRVETREAKPLTIGVNA